MGRHGKSQAVGRTHRHRAGSGADDARSDQFHGNASGTYRDVMCDTACAVFQGATDWSVVVLVDKTLPPQRTGYAPGEHADITTWYGLALPPSNSPHNPNECTLCSDPARAQVVMIDPRTFEAVALPGGHLIMPDVPAARASQLLWIACSQAGSTNSTT